jgi:hypothetical protein
VEKKRRYKKNKTPNQSEKCGILFKKDYKTTFDELRKKYKDNYEDQASYQTSKRFFIDA